MRVWLATVGALVGAIGVVAAACDSGSETAVGTGGAPPSTGVFMTSSGVGGCFNLECQQVQCPAGQSTTVTGTVFAPEGTLPLYNALVFVPNRALEPIATGASCGCDVSGEAVVNTLTDTAGNFVLSDVPVGDNIPLVVQVGKWRKEITLPVVTQCVENPITNDAETTLPSNQSEGNIPKIALTTGGADALECLLRKIGIDAEEFTLSSGSGRVNLFEGSGGVSQYAGSMNGGASLEAAQPFWSDPATLMGYDMVILSCEGGQDVGAKPQGARQAMQDYANAGGRVFMSHWHNVWLEQGPPQWPATAVWDFQSDPPEPYTGIVDQSFPKGSALAQWLVNVGGSTVLGELPITAPQHTVDTVNTSLNVQPWITGAPPPGPDPGSVKYFTFNTPLAAPNDQLCGRTVFTDIHVSSGDNPGADFPSGCMPSGLTPQEKALVFMLFDLSACITPEGEPPVPPPIN